MPDPIDWPRSRAFRPVSARFGSTTNKSGFEAFFSADREQVSHLSDRLLTTIELGRMSAADAGYASALLQYLDSTGTAVRFPPQHRRGNVGSLAGNPIVSGAHAAGVRSITLAGATGRNRLLGGSFEFDTDANGLGDGWSIYSAGTTGAITYSRVGGGTAGAYKQRLSIANLGATSSDRAGIYRIDTAVPAGVPFTLSASLGVGTIGPSKAGFYVDFVDVANASTGTFYDLSFQPPTGGSMARFSLSGTTPAATVRALVYVWALDRASAAGASTLDIDAVQLELGPLTAYEGGATLAPGDFISVAGNLLMCGPAGAVANDAGIVTVPLVLPLQRAAASGGAVVAAGATGLWKLDTAGIAFDFSAPAFQQQGISLPFRQFIA